MSKSHTLTSKAIDATAWQLPFQLSPSVAGYEVRVLLESMTKQNRALIDNDDLPPTYIRWWLRVAEHLLSTKRVSLSIKKTPDGWRKRPAEYVTYEFTFYDMLTLMADSHGSWGLGWAECATPIGAVDGCIIPALPFGLVIAGPQSACKEILDLLEDEA